MVFHSLRNHDRPLIIDQVKYMRELLEYMLEQCCEVVHDYSELHSCLIVSTEDLMLKTIGTFFKKYNLSAEIAICNLKGNSFTCYYYDSHIMVSPKS